MKRGHRFLLAAAFVFASGQAASGLEFPAGSALQAEEVSIGQASFPTGRFTGSTAAVVKAEGQVLRQVWKVSGSSQSSFQLLSSLKEQLTEDGFVVLFQCQSVSCGGYDFRFEYGHFDAPDMYVDLGDYHYLSALNGTDHIGLLVSRSSSDAFVELLQVGEELKRPTQNAARLPVAIPSDDQNLPLSERLQRSGHVVLSGLEFATGSSNLEDGDDVELVALARFLLEFPDSRVLLVGHTDAVGGLDGNVALSRKRANAVMSRLVEQYGVKAAQISAEGIGYLAPTASNLTDEGRSANRRVEAVLLSLK